MGTLKLSNSSGNFVALTPPSSIASDVTLTLPNTDGDANQYLQTNGSGALTWATVTDTNTNVTRMTAVDANASTIDFTIPSGVRRITVIFDQVSASGDHSLRVQIGTGGSPLTSGYVGRCTYLSSSTGNQANYSSGFDIRHYDNRFDCTGTMTISNITGNTWISTHNMSSTGWSTNYIGSGVATLSGELDLIRVTNSSASALDNGQLNVMYEV